MVIETPRVLQLAKYRFFSFFGKSIPNKVVKMLKSHILATQTTKA